MRLLAEEGEILYSLSEVPEDGRERGTEAPMLRYGGEVRLEAPEGQARSYRLTACTVDRAGNRSRTTLVWLLSVDRQSVYAAPEGDDRADGSRGRPLRSLERAASLAREQGRTRLLLAEGAYPLTREVLLEGDLRIEGGFAPQTWEKPRFEQRSVLEGTGRFPAGSPLLRVRSGSVVLSGLELRDAGRLSGALVEVEGGRLEASGLRLALYAAPGGGARQALGVLQQGGSLLLQNCELQAEGVRQGALVESTAGDSRLVACRLTGPREADDFVAMRFGGTGRHTLDRVQVDPGKGRRTASLRARGTRIEVSESTLRTGAGSELGVSIELEDAGLRVVSSRLAGDPAAAYTVGVRATRSQVHLERTELIAAARFGAAGLFLRDGRTEVSRSTLRGEDSGEYCTLVDAAAGRAVFTNNLLLGPRSGDSLAALLAGVDSEWLHNTLRGGTGRNLTIGLWVEEGSRLRLINNLLFREEGNQGSALRLRRAGTAARPAALGGSGEGLGAWEVQANCFSGWGTLLETGGAEPGAPSAERLNGADGDWSGGRFRGNIEEPWPQSLPKADSGDYHLATGSRCVNGGLEAGVRLDLDGQPRPAPYTGGRALPDIGADEVH